MHNLIAGVVYTWPEPNRFTPYFLPHSTDIAGLTTIFAGDDRFYNNIFIGIGDKADKDSRLKFGTEGYNSTKLPVWMSGNIFYNGSKPSVYEKNFIESAGYDPAVWLTEEGENAYLHLTPDQKYFSHKVVMITSEILGIAKIPKAGFENPDGSPLIFDKDYFGKTRSPGNVLSGPFTDTSKEKMILKVW